MIDDVAKYHRNVLKKWVLKMIIFLSYFKQLLVDMKNLFEIMSMKL